MPTNLVLGTFGSPNAFAAGGSVADIRLQEANHRIANSLSLVAGLLQMQAAEIQAGRALAAGEAAELLNEAAGRVHLVGRLHRLLARPHQDEALDLPLFLLEIAENTATLLAPPERVKVTLAAAGVCTADSTLALPIGLIVGELVTNSIKYAHPTGVRALIRLDCRHGLDGGLTVEVADDGVGLPEGFDPRAARSLGMRLVHSLATQVGGRLSFHDKGTGLTVRLSIPGRE